VPDADAVKPEEWDDEEDGAWTAPLVPNPKCAAAPGCGAWVRPSKANPAYKGKWSAPYVDNPAFKGEWAPRKIANPDYAEDLTPSHFSSIGGIGFELWTMDEDLAFDNIYVGHSVEEAKALADETWARKLPIEQGKEKKEEESAAQKAKEAAKEAAATAVPLFDSLREKLLEFVGALGNDPLGALKAHPDVAGAVGALFAGLLALITLVAGVGSSAPKPTKGAKKTDAPSKAVKATAVAPAPEAKKRTPVAATVEDE
jgi:calnexin